MSGPLRAVPEPARITAKRPKSETRQRTAMIAVRCTPDEAAEIKAAAERQGISTGALLRACFHLLADASETSHA